MKPTEIIQYEEQYLDGVHVGCTFEDDEFFIAIDNPEEGELTEQYYSMEITFDMDYGLRLDALCDTLEQAKSIAAEVYELHKKIKEQMSWK